ncbi:MAG: ATP-binding protein [Caldilineaceae bacterium]
MYVEDDGPGIDSAFHERIFQIFQTLQPRDEVEGSGMGLAVVKKAVESMGGIIRVESIWEGAGATFRFTWPQVSREKISRRPALLGSKFWFSGSSTYLTWSGINATINLLHRDIFLKQHA